MRWVIYEGILQHPVTNFRSGLPIQKKENQRYFVGLRATKPSLLKMITTRNITT
jgi:hypothetical protein